MILRPPRSTRTDTLFPYTTLFRSCDADGVAFSSFRHGVLRARVDEPSNCERRCGHLGWDIECSQDLGQMDRLYLEPAGHDASEVEVASRIVAAERQPAPAAGKGQAMAVGRHHDQRNVVHHPRPRHELSIWQIGRAHV